MSTPFSLHKIKRYAHSHIFTNFITIFLILVTLFIVFINIVSIREHFLFYMFIDTIMFKLKSNFTYFSVFIIMSVSSIFPLK